MDLDAYHHALNQGFSESEAEKIGDDDWEENEYQRMKYEDECVLVCNEIVFKESKRRFKNLGKRFDSYFSRKYLRNFRHMWE